MRGISSLFESAPENYECYQSYGWSYGQIPKATKESFREGWNQGRRHVCAWNAILAGPCRAHCPGWSPRMANRCATKTSRNLLDSYDPEDLGGVLPLRPLLRIIYSKNLRERNPGEGSQFQDLGRFFVCVCVWHRVLQARVCFAFLRQQGPATATALRSTSE